MKKNSEAGKTDTEEQITKELSLTLKRKTKAKIKAFL